MGGGSAGKQIPGRLASFAASETLPIPAEPMAGYDKPLLSGSGGPIEGMKSVRALSGYSWVR